MLYTSFVFTLEYDTMKSTHCELLSQANLRSYWMRSDEQLKALNTWVLAFLFTVSLQLPPTRIPSYFPLTFSLENCLWIVLRLFCSVAQSCLILCDPMDSSIAGFLFLQQFPEFAQTHVHQVGDSIQPFHPIISFFSCLQSFLASGAIPMCWLFTSCGQNIGASSTASVLPMNIQDWFPLGLTDLIS